MKTLQRCLTALCAACLLLCLALPALAAGEQTTVRVGCPSIDSFLTRDENGIYTGYGAEYLAEIARYTDWNFEYVDGTWAQCLEWLKEGKIDLLMPAERTEQRAADYLFSSCACCVEYAALLTRQDEQRFQYGDASGFDGMTVGMIAGSFHNDTFRAYAKEQGFAFQEKIYQSSGELFQALETGEVDAAVRGNLSISPELKVLAKLGYENAYFITGKQNAALMEQLDDVLCRIELEDPQFKAELVARYYGAAERLSQEYTAAEQEFIASCPPLRVMCDSDNPPFEWYDEETGSYRGVDVDILKLLAQRSGLDLEFVTTQNLAQSWNGIRDGEADLLAGVYVDAKLEREYNIRRTDFYTTESYLAVTRVGETGGLSGNLTAAVNVSTVGLREYLANEHPDWVMARAESREDCLDMVSREKADLTFISLMTLQSKPVLEGYRGLTTGSGMLVNLPICLGVREDADPLLLSVLNKAIAQISAAEIQTISASNTASARPDVTLSGMIRAHPGAALALLALACTLISAAVFSGVHARTERRLAAELTKKNIQLQAANAAKTDFLSRMSHDIRTPMNAIIGMTAIARGDNRDPAVEDSLAKIDQSGQFLLGLINDILDLTKIESGNLELHPQPFSLRQFDREIQTIIEPLMRQKHIAFRYEMNCGAENIRTDSVRFNQIFFNLLSNAAKYTPEGGEVSFTAERLSTEGNIERVRFRVKDSGIGMSEEFLLRAFDPFEQEERKSDMQWQSTGLGLPIVKELVEKMGGVVALNSRLGEGTEAVVDLPLEVLPPEREKPTAAETPESRGLEGRRVLLAEDNHINALVARRLLEKRGVLVELEENGKKAVERFSASPENYYDAVLMDVRMPEMNGLDAARAIRALPRGDAAAVPILAMTANAYDEDREESRKAGMNGHLSKPVDPEELYRALEQNIAAREAGSADPEQMKPIKKE